MTTSASPEIMVTEEWIEVRFPEPVEAIDLSLGQNTYTRLETKTLGFDREEIDDRTVRWTPTEKYRPTPGEELQFRLRWGTAEDRHDEAFIVRVSDPDRTVVGGETGDPAEQAAQAEEAENPWNGPTEEPEQAPATEAPPAAHEVPDDMRAFETGCGVIVMFPESVADENLDVAMVVDRDKLHPSEHGWRMQRVADDAIEFLPIAPEALERRVLRLSLRFAAAGGPREETIQVPLLKRAVKGPLGAGAAPAGAGGTGRGRATGGRRGRAPRGATPRAGGTFGASRRTGARAAQRRVRGLDPRSVLELPFRVADGGGGGGGVGGGGGTGRADGFAAVVDGITGNVLPRLGRSAGPRQFRESLAELAARSGAPTASPFVSASPSATAGTARLPGLGMAISDLGSPFATLLAEADALERVGLPVIRDVRPIVDDADLDVVEARRTLTAEAATHLIEELRQQSPDGPETAVVLAHLGALQQQSALLREALGINDPNNAVSPEDFANVSRFDVLDGRIAALLALDQTAADDDPRVLIGDLKQQLGVIDENIRELVQELDFAGVGPQERATTVVEPLKEDGNPRDDVPPITLARLEDWISDETGRNLIYQLDRAGRLAGTVVAQTLALQQVYIQALRDFIDDGLFPWTYPIIERVVDELDAAYTSAIIQAQLVDPAT